MKGSIQPAHIAVNLYELLFVGIPKLTATTVSGLEEELQAVDMPDRTKASGGHTGPSEFTATFPLHHSTEVLALEAWFREGQHPVSPTYKKPGSLLMQSISPIGAVRTYQLVGVFMTKRKLPDLDMANDGELALAECTFSVDQILPG
jgi:hypothetical protein